MATAHTQHICGDCGHAEPRWLGQCPGCGAWNTLVEESQPVAAAAAQRRKGTAAPPGRLAEDSSERLPRLPTGIGEFDRVLGGGLVPGSLVLLGGSPGIGKSTLP